MSLLADSTASFAAFALSLHFVSAALAAWRARGGAPAAAAGPAPGITLVRPMCGLDFDAERLIESSFTLDHRSLEILFCFEREDDAAVPLVREAIARHPHVVARILIGADRIGDNPKLNNMLKGWRAARHDWICFTDSNLLPGGDYLQRLLAAWDAETGCVSAPPVGAGAQGFAAEVECAFLNGYQARWQYAVDTLGFGFAQGKTLFFRRADLTAAGGLAALADEPAEDAAATKVVRRMGRKVRLASPPFVQPIGKRRPGQVWQRQTRWARLRRATFPALYLWEIFAGPLLPLGAALLSAAMKDIPLLPTGLGFVALWYGAEAALLAAARWQLTWRSPIAWVLRDLLLPALWVAGLAGRSFVWREVELQEPAAATRS